MWFLRKMAWPISLIYGSVVRVRNWLYDVHFFNSRSFGTPTLCVGNLSVGGTGKTPMIEFLISRLQDTKRLAVLSRGYKRKSKGFQMADADSTVESIGDEPLQIHKKFPNVTVAVDGNRGKGMASLEKLIKPDLVLLDDAFQHRRVTPTFSILLTTYANPIFKDWYLPTGSLRDSKYAAGRADVIIVTKCPHVLDKKEMDWFATRLQKRKNQTILFATLQYDPVLYGKESSIKLSDLKDMEFTLVTGIATPAPLVNHLKENDLVFEHLEFSDHHSFSSLEIDRLSKKGLIVTTEKDYTRLEGKMENLYFVRIEHHFLDQGEKRLMQLIDSELTLYR